MKIYNCTLILISLSFLSWDVPKWKALIRQIFIPEQQSNEKYKDNEENPFMNVADQETSTFAIDADGGSYTNSRRFLNAGVTPPKEAVRIEESYKLFYLLIIKTLSTVKMCLYNLSLPMSMECRHYLLRLGMKGYPSP